MLISPEPIVNQAFLCEKWQKTVYVDRVMWPNVVVFVLIWTLLHK